MENKKKIQPFVKKYKNHKEAELADNEYWKNLTPEKRLEEWISVYNNYCYFIGLNEKERIKKTVIKTKLNAV